VLARVLLNWKIDDLLLQAKTLYDDFQLSHMRDRCYNL
jgi:hypothetical protein